MVPEPLDASVVSDLERTLPGPVEHVQTHLSHVFLTPDRVYKLHKAARFNFVDFGTRALRNADALAEVRLNRRLAPDVYLGVAPVVRAAQGFAVGAVDEALAGDAEHLVVMRRLPDGRDALALLERGELGPEQLLPLAKQLAEFHRNARLSVPAPFTPEAWRARVWEPVQACFEALREGPLSSRALAGERRVRARARELAPRFERRRREGRAVEGHGDLHLQHIWLEPGRAPVVIDCIAFGDELRRIDAAADVAFLAMDLAYRGARPLGERFLAHYAALADDHDLYAVVDYFLAYRAAVRAKVADLATRDPELAAAQRERAAESARRHLELALRTIEPAPPAPLVVFTGLVGSGKSTAAVALAEELGGVVVASDRVRKARAGLPPMARVSEREKADLYSPAATRATYDALLERARTIAASGRPAVLDATYAKRAWRDEVAALADELGVHVDLVETTCERSVLLARLRARALRDDDPSDAGPERLAASERGFDPVDGWPAPRRHRIAMDAADWREQLGRVAEAVRSPGV